MRRGQIEHVHVIAYAGAVRGGVVVAEQFQPGNDADGGHEGARDKVGFRGVHFAAFALGVGPGPR